MTVDAIERIVRRSLEDPSFCIEFARDPSAALHPYELSMPERQALIAGDVTKLESLGVPNDVALAAGELNRRADEAR